MYARKKHLMMCKLLSAYYNSVLRKQSQARKHCKNAKLLALKQISGDKMLLICELFVNLQ